jgi:tRNA (mo5U34)-methyltransferase
VHGVVVDAEWRSDLKWERVARHATSLSGSRVLDVGCGNGYYCLRALGEGAKAVLGIDPSPRFTMQFEALRRLMSPVPAWVLPLRLEDLPADVTNFDRVLSMGVLYHRRSPHSHLADLRGRLRSGGELVLETLTVPESFSSELVPNGRYANMRNVWSVPSEKTLLRWVSGAGFESAAIVDTTWTTPFEQRTTAWMPLRSLSDALDPTAPTKTIEGYPAPRRTLLIARK